MHANTPTSHSSRALAAAASVRRLRVGEANICSVSFADAVNTLIEHARRSRKTACVVTPNAQHVVLLEDDPKLRNIYNSAEYVFPDGASLLFAARIRGRRFRERIAGVDLFQALCARAEVEGLRVFLLGGAPGSAAMAAGALQTRHPRLQIVGITVPPFGFEADSAELAKVNDSIRIAKPDLLFAGLGAPKQEYWMHEHGRKLEVPLCVGVGGAFEMVSGSIPRAPEWMQSAGFEWLFRLAMEPGRLWKRYLLGNCQFMFIVLRQAVKERWSPA